MDEGWREYKLFLGFLPKDISTAGDIPSLDDGWGQEVNQDLNLPSREGLKVRRDLLKRTLDWTTVNLWKRKHGNITANKFTKRTQTSSPEKPWKVLSQSVMESHPLPVSKQWNPEGNFWSHRKFSNPLQKNWNKIVRRSHRMSHPTRLATTTA